MKSQLLNKIIGYFFAGLALILPIVLTVWLLFYVFRLLNQYLNSASAMIGAFVFLVGLIPIGYIATTFIGESVWGKIENVIIKTPLLGLVYKAIKDVTKALVGTENKFTEPVLVEIHEGALFKIGFVTNKEISHITGDKPLTDNDSEMYMVYFPLSFSFSGDLFLVPRTKLRPIDSHSKDIMQAIVSGGIIEMD